MTNIYILTEEGKAWNEDGLDYLASEVLPRVGLDPDDTQAVMGALYNDPALMARELKENPDSLVVFSYEHIEVFLPEACKKFADMFASETKGRTSWQIVRDAMQDA